MSQTPDAPPARLRPDSDAAAPGVSALQVESALQEAFSPSALEVHDDSHLHAGHAGAREGRHFRVRLVSHRFAGLGRVARHRLVYSALGPLIARGIHALVIDARDPGEA